MFEYKFEENARLSGELAADGMVLLENRDELLPFEGGVGVAVFGSGQIDFSMGGTGSAAVFTAYRVGAMDGLEEQEKAGRIRVDREVAAAYRDNPALEETAEFISAAAGRNRAALLILSRNAGEGKDRRDVPGDYRLTEHEEKLLELLISSPFERIAVVVNSGGLMDLAWMRRSEKLKSLLLAWQPGMRGGQALARVLCGEVNPSGRLTDTVADAYSSYPSSRSFQAFRQEMEYEEDIFVGYRYFETIPGASAKVLYPFGYGLSYTVFRVESAGFSCDGERICCLARVINTGKRAGRQVVQLYSSSPAGKLEHPALELRAFAKTGMLEPGAEQVLKLEIPVADLASFDDSGASGAPRGSFVLEPGDYILRLGTSVRDTVAVGKFTRSDLLVLSSPGILLQHGLSRKMRVDGGFDETRIVPPYHDLEIDSDPVISAAGTRRRIKLSDVASGACSMADFLAQLELKELIHLCHGQPSLFPTGTGGFGNLRRYGVPNPQTADGPAGLRKAVYTTCFPCATLVGCSWDAELQYRMGAALGREGIDSEVDILLAPGLNIHRDVLCGRNFEYFSEDPLVSGKSAAALVRGVQAQGLGATIKHFAVNSRENFRRFTDSVVSERALREIYLRGFEIAVKESSPWCVMSSYNLLNSEKTSCNYNLLVRILREEWGFDGLVMTDWRNDSVFWKELIAGNDVRMPLGGAAEYDLAETLHSAFRLLPRKALERNAANVLRLVMKTKRFRDGDFGRIHPVDAGETRLKAAEMTSVNNGRSKFADCGDVGGGVCHCHLLNSFIGDPQELIYFLEVGRPGRRRVSFRLATDSAVGRIEVLVDGRNFGSFKVEPTQPPRSAEENAADPFGKEFQSWTTEGNLEVDLPAGECELMVRIYNEGIHSSGISMNYLTLTPLD